MAKKVAAKSLATASVERRSKTAAAKSPGVAKKPKPVARRKSGPYDGTAEELDAFLDRLLERGDQLKKEFAELADRIRRGT